MTYVLVWLFAWWTFYFRSVLRTCVLKAVIGVFLCFVWLHHLGTIQREQNAKAELCITFFGNPRGHRCPWWKQQCILLKRWIAVALCQSAVAFVLKLRLSLLKATSFVLTHLSEWVFSPVSVWPIDVCCRDAIHVLFKVPGRAFDKIRVDQWHSPIIDLSPVHWQHIPVQSYPSHYALELCWQHDDVTKCYLLALVSCLGSMHQKGENLGRTSCWMKHREQRINSSSLAVYPTANQTLAHFQRHFTSLVGLAESIDVCIQCACMTSVSTT